MTAIPLPSPGARLKQLRLAARMTQATLARLSGVSQAFLSYLERDQFKPSQMELEPLAKALNADLQWLFTGELSPNAPPPVLERTYPAGWPKDKRQNAEALVALVVESPEAFVEMSRAVGRAKGKKK